MGEITEEEYLKAKAIVDAYESIIKRIAVVCLDVHDFINYRNDVGSDSNSIHTISRFKLRNKLYIRVSDPNELVGVRFDDYVETQQAQRNTRYEDIKVTLIQNCLKHE